MLLSEVVEFSLPGCNLWERDLIFRTQHWLYLIVSRTRDTKSHTGNCKFSRQKVCGFSVGFFLFSACLN